VKQTIAKTKGIQSHKMRFFDKGGIGSDVFRFLYLNEEDFRKKILSQTLLGYVPREGKKVKQKSLGDLLQ